MSTGTQPARPAGAPTSALRIVGFLLRHRLFSAPLPFEASDLVEAGHRNFLLVGPQLPPELRQFQEALDVALGSLPRVDWARCARGAAHVELMVKQVRVPGGSRAGERGRGPEPKQAQQVFMDLPHHDVYYPGADYFVVSDAPWSTLFYPQGAQGTPLRLPPHAVVRYDAVSLHSAPGFCPAAAGKGESEGQVLRTFVRLLAWDPLWTLDRFPHFAQLLSPAPPAEWERPATCEAEDVIHSCFDAVYTCERCCDLRWGALGDDACWAGWMTYEKCCGPASRRWGGCGWRHGADLWGQDYFSLQPPQLHSAAQCQQRCEEEPGCGGWTYFPQSWEPAGCRLPLAAVVGLRRVCLLRSGALVAPTPHRGLLWGPRECGSSSRGCLEVGVDRIGLELALHRDVPDVRACGELCRSRDECEAFAYFPDDYQGDTSDGCLLPVAVADTWKSRCLLKTAPVPHGGPQWLPLLSNVVSGSRTCAPAAPWSRRVAQGGRAANRIVAGGGGRQRDAEQAVDGDYGLGDCVVHGPWRAEFDAEYLVSHANLWFGDRATFYTRKMRRYVVALVVASNDGQSEELLPCGSVLEPVDGGPVTSDCRLVARAARAVSVSAEDPSSGFALCEVELRVGPVSCENLISEWVTIHSRAVRIFPPGAAQLLAPGSERGEACERNGGTIVSLAARGGTAVCIEAACAPSSCLETFDADPEAFMSFTGVGLWDPRIESVAELCTRTGPEGGRLYEATVIIHHGGRSDDGVPRNALTSHSSFCVPRSCSNDGAASVIYRQASARGVSLQLLSPETELELRNVRPLASWEDVRLDFLIAGFPRSGTHSVLGNLEMHSEVSMADKELTFNWGYLPLQGQVQEVAASFPEEDTSGGKQRLRGGKGEGVALSPRILRSVSAVPGLRLIVVVREPVEWLESIYNLRVLGCRQTGRCEVVPSLEDVILRGATFQDVDVQAATLSDSIEAALQHFPPSHGRLLLLEFELLRSHPREFYDRLCRFLGIAPFPANFTFGKFGTEERKQSESLGRRTSLCSGELQPALTALQQRLAQHGEYHRLARFIAASGSPWVSSRIALNRTHCS